MNAAWGLYKYFKKSEFDCRHTGRNLMQHEFMTRLEELREAFRQPMTITSGYRDPSHPVEAKKTGSGGEHTLGMCCDVACGVEDRYRLVKLAMEVGFTRIGIADTFVHIGMSQTKPTPRIWTY